MKAGVEEVDAPKWVFSSIKFSVKSVEGIQNADETPYELSFDPDGALSDECVSEILGLDLSAKLVTACSLLSREIKEHEIPGVSIELKGLVNSKKKAQ